METHEYVVPGLSCAHCETAIRAEVATIAGVVGIVVDLAAKRVVVSGDGFGDEAVRAAIDAAGYDVE